MASTSQAPTQGPWEVVWQVVGFVCLGLLTAAMLLYHTAAPEPETFLDRATDAHVRTTWDLGLVDWSRRLVVASFALSTLGVVVHAVRRRNRLHRHLGLAFTVFLAASVGLWVLFH